MTISCIDCCNLSHYLYVSRTKRHCDLAGRDIDRRPTLRRSEDVAPEWCPLRVKETRE